MGIRYIKTCCVLLLVLITHSIEGSATDISLADICNQTIKVNQSGDVMAHFNASSECQWNFTVAESNHTLVIFNVIEIGNDDTVKIQDGNETIANLTGDQAPFVAFFWKQSFKLIFRTKSESGATIGISYKNNYTETDCTMEFDGPLASFQAPVSDSLDDEHILTCKFVFTSKQQSTDRVLLSFSEMNGAYGNITVHDGYENSTVLAYLTNNNLETIPDDVITVESTFMTIVLNFPSNFSQQQTFKATMESVRQDCNKVITMNDTEQVNILSSDYPGNYSNNLACHWIIHAPEGMTFKISFSSLNLADQYDIVSINDGGNKMSSEIVQIRKMNQLKYTDQVFMTNGNKLWIQFSTDESLVSTGFNISIEPSSFGGRLINNTGVIQYDASAHTAEDPVIFQITVLADKKVSLRPQVSRTVPESVVTVYDGLTTSDTVIASFKSTTPLYNITASSNKMMVVLRGYTSSITSFNASYNGIPAEFSRIENHIAASGIITTSTWKVQAAVNYKNYDWIITPTQLTGTLQLTVNKVVLYGDNTIKIYSGLTESWNLVATFNSSLNGKQVPALQVSTSDHNPGMRIVYNFGTTLANPVFQALYQSLPECTLKVDLNQANSVSLTSPYYPNQYPMNSKCTWNITTGKNLLFIKINTLRLAPSDTLSFYKVNPNKTLVATLDSTSLLNDFVWSISSGDKDKNVTDSSYLWIEFDTVGGSTVGTGFSIDVQHLDCGGMLTSMKSSILTPAWPALVMQNTTCVWILSLTKSAVNTSNIISFDYNVKGTASSQSNALVIHDGRTSLSPPLYLNTSTKSTKHILSRTNSLWLKYTFVKMNENSTSKGFAFNITYSNYTCSKANQCNNGICLHPDWKCDGIDQCGDMTDEKGCIQIEKEKLKGKVSSVTFGLTVVSAFIVGLLIAIFIPMCYKRWKYPNYTQLRDVMTPVNT